LRGFGPAPLEAMMKPMQMQISVRIGDIDEVQALMQALVDEFENLPESVKSALAAMIDEENTNELH
jgi:hypothetical protein